MRQVFEPSREVDTPPSLPITRWFESNGSIQNAW